MTTLSINLPSDEAERLAELAQREGKTPEAVALDAVRARIDGDAAWIADVEAGLAELESGAGVTMEDFEREMDAFMHQLRATPG